MEQHLNKVQLIFKLDLIIFSRILNVVFHNEFKTQYIFFVILFLFYFSFNYIQFTMKVTVNVAYSLIKCIRNYSKLNKIYIIIQKLN